MRVLVTGSRNWPAPGAVWKILDIIAEEHCQDKRLYLRHGGCPEGADMAAHNWCDVNPAPVSCYVTEEICRAAWPLGKGAGYARNQRMVNDDKADLCVAFIAPCVKRECVKPKPHGSHGAIHCADYAESHGVMTWRYAA